MSVFKKLKLSFCGDMLLMIFFDQNNYNKI